MLRLGADAIAYLSSPLNRETYGQAEFAASLAIAKLVLHASAHDTTYLARCLIGDTRNPPSIRVWNLISLAGLRSADPNVATRLLALLPNFVMVYVSLLRLPLSDVSNESAAPNVNHAFASVKLWMLIARKSCMETSVHDTTGNDTLDSDGAERRVWNELWPPFERLIQSFISDPDGEMPASSCLAVIGLPVTSDVVFSLY